ncbi:MULTISPECIES: YidH family protein [Dickeya]|uniref:Inner membrane protein, related to oxidative stress response n=1 Tax=Dickeya aquatica TaxID=1401087 RepID=A0A375A5I8_9GAMM|nr:MULTISPECIES: DUF202 domain-containing protein [unclassified Dickeya]SLM61334.1 Putative inner membrane protein, related to oxidative stress response [Dickeya aquatica]
MNLPPSPPPAQQAAPARSPHWQQQGHAPDYRFSLANERTFLAWIRTALAFLAGAIAIDQFAPMLATPVLRTVAAIFLSLASALLAWMAYRRWAGNERAMRTGQPLPYTRLLLVMASLVCTLSLGLALVMVWH